MYKIYKLSKSAWLVIDPDNIVFAQKGTEAEAQQICDEQNEVDITFEVFKKLNGR